MKKATIFNEGLAGESQVFLSWEIICRNLSLSLIGVHLLTELA